MNRTTYVLTCLALYSAIMLALAWALWQVMPGVVDWANETFGQNVVTLLMFAFVPLCYLVAYLAGRRDSGSA